MIYVMEAGIMRSGRDVVILKYKMLDDIEIELFSSNF
ncbi:hypothetical protein OIU77_007443 [Salix suchowensis]|uniref:Uncharacterized protein n=1 Tax=Salix suchowensis TaxID=1278906 RepID=A0ABQ9AHB6_9ROSI|nr:hypothetical protein OIU77_007443 [Salix suchowensis]